jgi:phosphoribosylamine--glycine ligase
MNVLILGSGGREHAFLWKISQSPQVNKIFCIPGNGGIGEDAETFSIPMSDFEKIRDFIESKKVDLTVVGPEQPLVDGIVDYLESYGLNVFGPRQAGAQLEGSKVFAKSFMKKFNIPTAGYAEFSDYQAAEDYLKRQPEGPIVVKADGLAAGKGSIVCHSLSDARKAIRSIMVDKIFASAGNRVIIEEFMTGEEASLFVLTDGKSYSILSPAQDFKRALDQDGGKNTGGMGSYAPTPFITDNMMDKAIHSIIEPVLDGLKAEGIVYKGMLYCGLMLTPEGPKVVEFNCRFGDPETQVVLPLLDADFIDVLQAVNSEKLRELKIPLKDLHSVCVILASGGYPDGYQKGKIITGLDQLDSDIVVFHAGTARKDHRLITSGGRVLGVMSTGNELKTAIDHVYQNIPKIKFDGIHYRTDIGKRAVQR